MWNLLLFAFELQVNKKQLQFVLQTVDKGTQYREKEKSKNRRKKEGSSSISGEQTPFTTGLRRFHRQPDIVVAQGSLLFPFSFSFSFSFVFCILQCSAKWTVESELIHSPLFMLHENSEEQLPQFTTGLRCFHRQPDITAAQGSLLFPFSFSFSFVLYILHCSWPDRVWSKPKCIGPVRPNKIKKSKKKLSYIVFYSKKTSV